jgi:hypothetical protein
MLCSEVRTMPRRRVPERPDLCKRVVERREILHQPVMQFEHIGGLAKPHYEV